jgi:hypothetical protein
MKSTVNTKLTPLPSLNCEQIVAILNKQWQNYGTNFRAYTASNPVDQRRFE